MELQFMLILDDVTQFIIGNDLIKLPIRQLNQKLDILMVCSIIILDLPCNFSTKLPTIISISNEG